MDLLLLSPEQVLSHEHSLVREFLHRGLTRYHVRKPGLSREELSAFLQGFDGAERQRLVLHQHHALASSLGLGGLHWPDRGEPEPEKYPNLSYSSSASHQPASALGRLGRVSVLLLSPVFDSLSKAHTKASGVDWSPVLQAAGEARRRTRCIALGGITLARLGACSEQGFDGVAVLGAVWLAEDPLQAFSLLHAACQALPASSTPVPVACPESSQSPGLSLGRASHGAEGPSFHSKPS